MPVRHYELSWPDGSHEVSAEGFLHSRISPTVYTTSGTHNPHIEDSRRPHKRRRLQPLRQGLVNRNSRFDKMLERVNGVPLVTPQESSSPLRSSKRGMSTSSISGSSEAAPPTPVDVYSALEGGRLGDGFMVFKARGKKGLAQVSSEPSRSRSPLPTWLSQTFATLEPHNPLRKLAAYSDTTHISGSHAYDKAIDHSIDFRSQLEHDGDEDAGKLAQDDVFTFYPSPRLERFITDVSSPLTNASASGRSLLPSLSCGSGAPESCNAERDSDDDTQLPLSSGHLTSLLEISPTSRPFGTHGPAFYPAIPILPSPLINSDTEALAGFTADFPHHLSSRLVFRDAIGPEVTSSQEDMTVGTLDLASPELSLSPEIIGYSGSIDDDHDVECVPFKEGTRDLDGDRLVMSDVPEGRYMQLVGLERPYFESLSEPLGIDVEFSFARAPHAAAPAADGLKSPSHQFIKQTMTAMSSPCCNEEDPEHPLCVSPVMTVVSSAKVDGSDNVRARDFIRGNSGQLFDANASSGPPTQDVDTRLTAGDRVPSELFTRAYFPQLPPLGGTSFNKSEFMRSTVPEQAVMQRQDMIIDQPYRSLGSSTCSGLPYSFSSHFSSIIATRALETANTRGEDGKSWRLGDPGSYSAHITDNGWEEYEHDSDKENEKPMLIADHISNTAVTSTFKSCGSDPGTELHPPWESHLNSPTADNLPSLPHTPKRQHVVEADPIVSDDELSLQVDVEMKLSLPARALTTANEPHTPGSQRIPTAQVGEQDDDALYWSKFSDDSIGNWEDLDNPPGSKHNDHITSKPHATQGWQEN